MIYNLKMLYSSQQQQQEQRSTYNTVQSIYRILYFSLVCANRIKWSSQWCLFRSRFRIDFPLQLIVAKKSAENVYLNDEKYLLTSDRSALF
jgi:hypothetical protein